ncbi:MAG: carboxymuconolactone decarboxylase family protein [Pseudomonadota bacterium]
MPQPALQRVPPDQLQERVREGWEKASALRGDATFFEVFGLRPDLYAWYADRFYGEVFHGGRCEPRHKELLRLRLSSVHGCRFCNLGNRPAALAAGLTEADVDAIAAGNEEALDPADAAVLALAEQLVLTNASGQLDTALHARLSEFFDDGQILELGLTGAVLTGMARMLFVFDLVEREPTCPFGHET